MSLTSAYGLWPYVVAIPNAVSFLSMLELSDKKQANDMNPTMYDFTSLDHVLTSLCQVQ